MRKYAIFVVDEGPDIRNILGSTPEGQGYEVTTADSIKAALEMITKKDFDLIIADVDMDQTDGIGLLGTVKKLKPDVKVIILTGGADADSAIDALRLGADDFMLKPIRPEELYFRVSVCLKKLECQKAEKSQKTLSMCCVCKKIRHESGKKPGKGEWVPVEKYVCEKGSLQITSAYCPECLKTHLGELAKKYKIKPAFAVFGTASSSRNEDE